MYAPFSISWLKRPTASMESVFPLRNQLATQILSIVYDAYGVGGFGARLTFWMARMLSEGSWQNFSGLAPGTLRDPSTIRVSCLPKETDFEVARTGSRSGSRTVTSLIAAMEQSEYSGIGGGFNKEVQAVVTSTGVMVWLTKQANPEAGGGCCLGDSR